MRIEELIPPPARDDVRAAIRAWHSGAPLSPKEQENVDLALRCNAAEQAGHTGFSSDRIESQTIEVGA